ncbi:hypothetical protein DYB37_011241 [Aphanomyces astaci]|uniref:Thioredoxin domain-containing protein n=1 Tax=Aphanomyces astaci TaxID=112090 RepID=A0A418EET3_APHAT|nr:hypothetical protein DYB35_011012 [Aphanomyces astaci]RHZ11987.1 hypothetical protein DYB37_011241 [Aphanomyces astaci]
MLATLSRRLPRVPRVRLSPCYRQMSTSFEKDEDGIVNIDTQADWDTILATGMTTTFSVHRLTFVKLNAGEEGVGPIKAAYNVEVLPAFLFFKDGQQVHTPVFGYKKKPLKEKVHRVSNLVLHQTFVRMNTGDEGVEPIKAALNVTVLPTFRFFNGGEEVGAPVTGYKKGQLEDQVTKLAL